MSQTCCEISFDYRKRPTSEKSSIEIDPLSRRLIHNFMSFLDALAQEK
jgi:hypothetical protein